MRKQILICAIGMALGQMSLTAAAAQVSFDFTAGNQNYTNGSYVFTGSDNSSTVTVSAGNEGGDHRSYLSGSAAGLLVCIGAHSSTPNADSSCGSSTNDYHYIDGGNGDDDADADEYISLDFGGNVTIDSVSFYSSSQGAFDLYADGTQVQNERKVTDLVEFLTGAEASEFKFLADGNSDYFSLTSITVTSVSQVPVPAAVWLFGSAIFGLATIKRTHHA
jgi:hypothetical protein